MKIIIKSFKELTISELYQILQLRSEVFVVEQDCVYQDLDGKDQKSLHLFGINPEISGDKIIGYTRLFKAGDYFENASIGRVVIDKIARKFGYGHQLMQASIKGIETYFNETIIEISAQKYLQEFYENHGFVFTGNAYLEDGIPHIRMIKNG